MTNPNNAVGTNAAFGGRTSVNAFNDDLAAFSRGILSGWECVPDSGMTLAIGGSATVRDVAVAEDDAGNKTTINNISLSPISITIGGAPASNTRIDSIVAYVDNPPQGTSTITDNYESCGIIVVPGTASASPVAPNESTIRTAITSDGASGSTAYYVVLADITVATGTTDLSSANISQTQISGLNSSNIDFTTSTDSEGWKKIPISNKINVYLNRGSYNKTMTPVSWGEETAAEKPIDLDTSNSFFGGVGGLSSDHAINVCGYIDWAGAKARVQLQNVHGGTVTSNIYWWAYIVEFLS